MIELIFAILLFVIIYFFGAMFGNKEKKYTRKRLLAYSFAIWIFAIGIISLDQYMHKKGYLDYSDKILFETSSEVFVGVKNEPDPEGLYHVQLTPSKKPEEAKEIYEGIRAGRKVYVLIKKGDASVLVKVKELYDQDHLKLEPASVEFQKNWEVIF